MLNQGAVDRGLFHLTAYRTYCEMEKKRTASSFEEICMPPAHCVKGADGKPLSQDHPDFFRRKNADYSLLDENGVIFPRIPLRRKCPNKKCNTLVYPDKLIFCPDCGSEGKEKIGGESIRVKKGDVIIGKVVVTTQKNGQERRIDISRVVQPGEEGTIDRVHVITTPSGYKLVKIVIRKIRVPILGDKLASRSAQKGTIGMIYPQEDMPFTSSGITPDIIMNPLAMPSRMTTNQLIECAIGKECCISGDYGDATPFTEHSVNVADKLVSEMKENIQKYGFRAHGWETLYNGMTGERIKAQIFIGPTYYQRLKHMVSDKMHARANGFVTTLTRQPVEGRSRDGGLRFGRLILYFAKLPEKVGVKILLVFV